MMATVEIVFTDSASLSSSIHFLELFCLQLTDICLPFLMVESDTENIFKQVKVLQTVSVWSNYVEA